MEVKMLLIGQILFGLKTIKENQEQFIEKILFRDLTKIAGVNMVESRL